MIIKGQLYPQPNLKDFFYTVGKGYSYKKWQFSNDQTTARMYSMVNIGNGYAKRLYGYDVDGIRRLIHEVSS